VLDEQYGADVRYVVALPKRLRHEFGRELAERTAGRGRVDDPPAADAADNEGEAG
jgi:hypothetical protein